MSGFRDFLNRFTIFIIILYSQCIIKNVDALDLDFGLNLGSIDCTWYKTLETFGDFFKSEPTASFFLSTKSSPKPVEIGENNWSGLVNSAFDEKKKTIVVIHGWKSNSTKPWVLNIARKLHFIRDVNVILVDWSEFASSINYFQVAEDTPNIANLISKFFNALKLNIGKNKPHSEDNLWNHLYFIGHSLGAHLSGQAAYALKRSDPEFWKIERITGLDPAKPCFVNDETKDHHKLDTTDADFVDIIHSNVGHNAHVLSFGLNERIGHMDFYIDGGANQAKCENLGPLDTMRCSHRLSHEFYTQSLTTSTHNDCKLYGHLWNGSHEAALRIFGAVIHHIVCKDCPEMGINAVESKKRGGYLVITAGLNHTCASYNDPEYVRKALEEIES